MHPSLGQNTLLGDEPLNPCRNRICRGTTSFWGISLCKDNFYWVFFEKSLSWGGRKASRFPIKVLRTAHCARVDPSGQM